MKIEDTAPTQRPNLHHVHEADEAVTAGTVHQHDIEDHYGRNIEAVTHTHDADGNITAYGMRHKPAKTKLTLPS